MNRFLKNLTCIRRLTSQTCLGLVALFGVMFLTASAQAQQDIRLRFTRPAPLRLTVSVNSTNVGTITNLVELSTNIVGSVTLSVSNLPAGCGYDLVTTNGSQGLSLSVTNDTPLTISVSSTNLPQGEYVFYLVGEGSGATNRMPFVLQSCYIWNGSGTNLGFNTNGFSVATFNWTNGPSWVGGNEPTTNSVNDVFFGSFGAHTNRDANGGIPSTNINISQNITVGSLRFGPGTYANTNGTVATNALYHHMLIAGNTTLSVISNRGFSLLRDYVAEYANAEGSGPDRRSALFISGSSSGARFLVNNTNANFSMLWDIGGSGDNALIMTNLSTFEANVNRLGFGDYQLYPNYRDMNPDTNGLGGVPRKFMSTVVLARTNLITAHYKSPDNYTNDLTRSYGIMWLNAEMSGNGSSEANQLHFGFTNVINSDSVCFVGGNMASGNQGFARFRAGVNNNGAKFRSTGGGRMSLFTISDGGGTNDAGSNIKANIDFWGGQTANFVDILTTNFYIARDRSIIAESNTVNYQGDFLMGKGTLDTITTILGYQEHEVKLNNDTPQLGYCRGTVTVTNGGLFKVNGQLTLGYTADTNDIAVAEQFNTWGRVTVRGASLIASNIIVDGGPKNYSHTEGTARGDSITLNLATMTVSNTIGNLPGQPLNTFTTERSTNVWFVAVGRTNLICRTLSTPGTAASVIKVASLTGVSSYPATVPIISYEFPTTPFLQADMSAVPGVFGYMLNNASGLSVDLFLTTNSPRQLLWKGNLSGNWDTNTANWVLLGGATPATFTIGDIAVFDDTALETNVTIVDTVVPGQTGAGVILSNYTKAFTFSGGTIAGTSSLLKVGPGALTINATKQGPATILEGSLEVGAGGLVGSTTLATNVFVNCLGTINGGLTSTGTVVIAASGTCNGPLNLQSGWILNAGIIASFPGAVTWGAGNITNLPGAVMNITGGTWIIPVGSTLANFGTINNNQLGTGRLDVNGTLVCPGGSIFDPDGGLNAAYNGRLTIQNPVGLLSLGDTITNMEVGTRFDLNAVNNTGWGTVIIKVDKTHPQTNDIIKIDLWNNLQGKIVMTNIQPSAPFADGDRFLVFSNTAGELTAMYPDAIGDRPTLEPGIPGPGLQWDLTEFRNFGVIKVRATSMVWRGNVNTNWDLGVTPNWLGGNTFTNSNGALFDDSANTNVVWLTSVVNPAGFSLLTTNLITTNVSPSGVTNIVYDQTTNSPTWSPGIVVSNAGDYFIGGSGSGCIQGFSGLYKTGPGTLTMGNMSNRFSEAVIIDQGVLSLPVFTNSFGNANSNFASPIGVFALNGRAPSGAERLIFNDSTFRYTGGTAGSSLGFTIGRTGATVEISNSAANLRVGGTIRGDGVLTKTGLGALTLGASGNGFTNITFNRGTLVVENGAAGAGVVVLNGGSYLVLTNASITNVFNVLSNTPISTTNTTVLGGSWFGSASVSITNLAPSIFTWTRDLTNYSGDITFVGNGTNRFNNATNSYRAQGSESVVFDLGSSRMENFTGGDTNGSITYHLGGLAGGTGSSLAGRFSNTVVTASGTIYSIGAKGSNTVFSGSIINGSGGGTVAIVKVGSGVLALNGVNTYTGPTTVSNGTLGGSGTLSSPITVVAGATLAPGSSVGKMTTSSNATLAGTTLMELDRISGISTNDHLAAASITASGDLIVTNIGPTIFNGATFQLFNQAVSNFATVTLPGAPYVWNNNLAVNGSITLASGGAVNTTPTTVTSSLSGGTLTLSWPSSHIGWRLTTQTNALSIGLTTPTNTWFDVSGSSTTNTVDITIDPTQPTVFFRLIYP